MNEDSFNGRVNKIFGSIAAASSSSSSSGAAWSLSDAKVEKKEWNRSALKQGKDDDDVTPCSSSYNDLFKHNRKRNMMMVKDVNDDDEGNDNDVWEIRSSIGLDSTLDNEDEEDEYDRVAEGRVGAGDRLYMRNIIDQETPSDASEHNILRDPRANHMAAQVRLKEDADATEKCETHFDSITLCGEQHSTKPLQDHCEVKPILKRKSKSENGGLKSMKRVRFDPSCKDECQEGSEVEVSWAAPASLNSSSDESESIVGCNKPKVPDHVLNPSKSMKRVRFDLSCKDERQEASEVEVSWGAPASLNSSSDESESILGRNKPKVPDHVLNPSKYTCYSLDSSSELDDRSNSRACKYLLEEIKKSNHDQFAREANPKAVAFVPRQKNTTAAKSELKGMVEEACNESLHAKGLGVSIAAGEAKKCEDPMEEDVETHIADTNIVSRKPERRYRSKSAMEDSVT